MSMDWKANERGGESPQGEKSRISVAMIIWIVVAILAIVFIAQNARDAQVKFLFWDGTLSLWVVIVLTLIAGALLDRLVTWMWRRRKAKQNPG
jgi:uncharacterized integral membrane protein